MTLCDAPVIVVVDMAFGDCGKGTIVDFLVRSAGSKLVVRFNGGPQAGHNVVTDDGRHHTFSQFGAGTFVPGVRTFLSQFMLIEPYALLNEASHLEKIGVSGALERLHIDGRCIVITPSHQAANRLRELARGTDAHGTCGIGVGETVADSIAHPRTTLRASDLSDFEKVRSVLEIVRERKFEEFRETIERLTDMRSARFAIETLTDPSWIEDAAQTYFAVARRVYIGDESVLADALSRGQVIFEGAQGVLLDEVHGFAPHTTWSNTTFDNAEVILRSCGYSGRVDRLGVLRSYFTRHGPGPFPTEDPSITVLEPHNDDQGWQGRFRVGHFDAVLAQYARMATGGVDSLAITHLDRVGVIPNQVLTGYRDEHGPRSDIIIPTPGGGLQPVYEAYEPASAEGFVKFIERKLSTHVSIESHGPKASDKRFS